MALGVVIYFFKNYLTMCWAPYVIHNCYTAIHALEAYYLETTKDRNLKFSTVMYSCCRYFLACTFSHYHQHPLGSENFATFN